MLELIVTNKFKKDLKRAQKQGKDLDLLQDVLQTLLEENELDAKHRDHALTENYIGLLQHCLYKLSIFQTNPHSTRILHTEYTFPKMPLTPL